jgi:hypothetical protein
MLAILLLAIVFRAVDYLKFAILSLLLPSFRSKLRVYVTGYICHTLPGILPIYVISYVVTPDFQMLKQIAFKVCLEDDRQIFGVLWFANKTCAAFDDVLAEGTHVGCNYWQTEAVRQKQNTALKYLRIGEHGHVCCFKKQLSLIVRNEFDLLDDLLRGKVMAD